jgi:SAM-dependent methyltransferase
LPTPEVIAFARGALPPPPARVLEVGAGDGELAAALADDGYDVLAIDPRPKADHVREMALLDLDEPPDSFDAAVAVVSLHHVEPLQPSLARLAEVVRPGGTVVIDELDVEALDQRAATWWIDHGGDGHDPAELIEAMRHHIHRLHAITAALAPDFELSEPVPGPYLHRWHLPPGLLEAEEAAIAAGEIPRVGVRIVGRRRSP